MLYVLSMMSEAHVHSFNHASRKRRGDELSLDCKYANPIFSMMNSKQSP